MNGVQIIAFWGRNVHILYVADLGGNDRFLLVMEFGKPAKFLTARRILESFWIFCDHDLRQVY